MTVLQLTACSLVLAALSACSHDPGAEGAMHAVAPTPALPMDVHSAARPIVSVIDHLDLDIAVDMAAKRIRGSATYHIAAGHGDTVIFDTDDLEITAVLSGTGEALEHSLGVSTFLGRPLSVVLPKGTDTVRIEYATGSGSRALQWLAPAQTGDKKQPFLFTQGEAILTRSWIPIQDSPGIRFTFNATVKVPKELMAVMSASNPTERSADGTYHFRMDQPIPAYLVALAVGDLAFLPLGERTGVYAEPGMVEKAAWEFADTEDMLTAAEGLYGPYRWDRYDIIVLPPSFPFGGMENPRLTFATPTIIAGDRSLTALVAHEMAHSWSGNLVTNATWDDFWLNEGFTVYFEKRICEAVYGKDYAAMLDLLGFQELQHTVEKIGKGKHPADTELKLHLEGRDPDDGMTDVAYEKGYAFLRVIEEKVGREKFDAFLRGYFDAHAFQSMTTERFLSYLDKELLKPNSVAVNTDAWVFGKGIPDNVLVPVSDAFAKVDVQLERWKTGTPAGELDAKGWVTFQWLHFLRQVPQGLSLEKMKDLDTAFGFTASNNAEILAAWLEQSVKNDYSPAYERLDQFLTSVGRRKFLMPLYEALVTTEKGKLIAATIYEKARPNYHSVSVRSIDELLQWEKRTGSISL